MENFMNQQLWLTVRVFLFGTKNGKGQLNRLFYFCNSVATDGHHTVPEQKLNISKKMTTKGTSTFPPELGLFTYQIS